MVVISVGHAKLTTGSMRVNAGVPNSHRLLKYEPVRPLGSARATDMEYRPTSGVRYVTL